MMNNIIDSHKEEFDKVIIFFKKDIKSLRTSRASVDLVSNLLVDAYGKKMPLKSLSNISIPQPRTILIEVWDKSIVKNVEKTLSTANLGAMPNVSGGSIRLNLPPLNEEGRINLIKILKTKLENAKNSLRIIRDKIREEIINAERDKKITQDEKYRYLEDLDKFTSEKQESIELIEENKKKEIITI